MKKSIGKIFSLTDDQKSILDDYPISIIGNNHTLKSEIICRYKIDFTKENSLGKILGFDRVIPAFEKALSEKLVNILQKEIIKVECNLSISSFDNSALSHLLYEFFPLTSLGYKIVEIPRNLIYCRVNTREIHEIKLRLLDQGNRLLNLRGETIHAWLHIRPNA